MNQHEPDDESLMKYIAGMLDPSEEKAFQNTMENDENILIEVQALKQTMKRLDLLPEFQPPAATLQAIRSMAGRPAANVIRLRYAVITAAAVLLLAVSLYLWRQQPSIPVEMPAAESQQPEVVPSIEPARLPAWTDRKRLLTIDNQVRLDSVSPSPRLKPVDQPSSSGAATPSVTLTRSN